MCSYSMLTMAAVAVLSGSFVGCAASDTAPGTRDIKEPLETVTGSNLPRRDKRDTAVREADKEAIESELRGATRNTGK